MTLTKGTRIRVIPPEKTKGYSPKSKIFFTWYIGTGLVIKGHRHGALCYLTSKAKQNKPPWGWVPRCQLRER